MSVDIELAGTSLKLKKGQKVVLIAATNQPKPNLALWYARPANSKGIWKEQNEETSILINSETDFVFT